MGWWNNNRNQIIGSVLAPGIGTVLGAKSDENRQEQQGQQRQAQQAQEASNTSASQYLQNNLPNYSTPGGGGSIALTGTPQEQAGQLAGLQFGQAGYGANIFETGRDIAGVRDQLKQRAAQGPNDPVSAAIMGQKAGAVAGAQRELNKQGIKGGVAAQASEAVGRQQDAQIASSLYGQQRQSTADLRSLLSGQLAGQTALMSGMKGEQIQMPEPPKSTGMFGSVICTELYNQGYMPLNTYMLDSQYGAILRVTSPEVIIGYHFWAKPVVKLMKKSTIFTTIVSYPALKWAKHIAGEEPSIFGKLCQLIGEPICGLIGKAVMTVNGVKNAITSN